MIGSSNAPGVLVGREDEAPQEVWKFRLGRQGRTEIEMPGSAKVVEVAAQNGHFTLWAVVVPGEKPQTRIFYVVGTGRPVSPNAHTYLGTLHDDPFVFHVFEGFR